MIFHSPQAVPFPFVSLYISCISPIGTCTYIHIYTLIYGHVCFPIIPYISPIYRCASAKEDVQEGGPPPAYLAVALVPLSHLYGPLACKIQTASGFGFRVGLELGVGSGLRLSVKEKPLCSAI